MKFNKHIIASVFLIFFSFIQLADLHAVGHDANDMDCKICQLASENIDDDFTSTDIIELPKSIIIPSDVVKNYYQKQYVDSSTKFSFLNKAPPAA
ncbi:hypothetical protein [uncultured Aquimarina sp.]|uniref:hypothetical protein n=1 Tax=uncultured Aquimarina sp. TaxID=575652 RepID=UPI00261C7E3F|nr:hypothetical protein [uncultured Aquimarina sp.]